MRQPGATRPAGVLLVEDSDADARLVELALGEVRVPTRVHRVADGAAALAFLHRHGVFSSAPRPDLVLLDLNLPGIDGREVLRAIKADGVLRRIPVVVFTSSSDADDVRQAYDNHANCFVTKPANVDDFLRVIDQIDEFFLAVVSLAG